MSRRSGQAGTIVKKGKMWCGRYYEDVPGQDPRKYLCVPLGPIKTMTKAEAKRKLRSILEKRGVNAVDYLERVNHQNGDVRTFAQEAKWWRENRLSLFKPSTQDKMNSHLEKYLLPRFGMVPVSVIDERQVQQFIAELSRTEYKTPKGTVKVLSPSTIPNIITVLKLIVGKKVWRDWNLRLPEIPFSEQRYFSTEEMVQIISAAKGQNDAETLQWRTLFAALAGTGLRCGEVFGLHVSDLDLNRGKLYVRRSVYQQREVSVKTKKSYRVVHIEAVLVQMLRQHLGGRTSGRVFQTRNGTPFSKDNVRRKLHSILDELKLKCGGLHAFRHGRVSFLRKSGVDDKIIKDWIGHSTLRMADLYTHFEDADRQQVVNGLGVLNGVSPWVPSVIPPNPPKSERVAPKSDAA
jgi:integrase